MLVSTAEEKTHLFTLTETWHALPSQEQPHINVGISFILTERNSSYCHTLILFSLIIPSMHLLECLSISGCQTHAHTNTFPHCSLSVHHSTEVSIKASTGVCPQSLDYDLILLKQLKGHTTGQQKAAERNSLLYLS